MLNRIYLLGNLVAAPSELRNAGQSQVCDFRLAVNEGRGDRERTLYIDVECWGKTAENVVRFLDKGRRIIVEGRLQIDEWESDGQRRSKPKVVANNVTFLGGEDSGNSGSGGERPRQQPQERRPASKPRRDEGVSF